MGAALTTRRAAAHGSQYKQLPSMALPSCRPVSALLTHLDRVSHPPTGNWLAQVGRALP